MILNDDQIALAAEYVLGTLDLVERQEAERLIASDPDFADLVQRWTQRLGELNALVPGVEPPATTWAAIRARIAMLGADEAAKSGGQVIRLSRRLRLWQGASAALGAVAAALILVIATQALRPDLLPGALRPPAPAMPGQFVAVLQRDPAAPAFIMSVDIEKRMFAVRRVVPEPEPGKSYELWLVSDRFDRPRSLGVIGDDPYMVSERLAAFDPRIINNATYAVTIEPQGGSPTGAATGPVVYSGRLIDAQPDRTR